MWLPAIFPFCETGFYENEAEWLKQERGKGVALWSQEGGNRLSRNVKEETSDGGEERGVLSRTKNGE